MSTAAAISTVLSHSEHDVFASYLERVVGLLGATQSGSSPPQRLEAVADTLRGTNWKSYRAGRVRLAGLTGMYWEWFTPCGHSDFVGRPDVPVAWRSACGVAADVFVCDADLDDPVTLDRVGAVAGNATTAFGPTFAGVRLLAMASPMSSKFISGDKTVPLSTTPWNFDSEARRD